MLKGVCTYVRMPSTCTFCCSDVTLANRLRRCASECAIGRLSQGTKKQMSVCCSSVFITNATGWRCAEIDEGNCVRRCGDAKEALPGSKHTIMVPDPPSILYVPGQVQGGHVVTLCS